MLSVFQLGSDLSGFSLCIAWLKELSPCGITFRVRSIVEVNIFHFSPHPVMATISGWHSEGLGSSFTGSIFYFL